MKDNILISGGMGFIGSHLCDLFVNRYNVTVIDDLSTGDINNISHIKNKINFIHKSVQDLELNDIKRRLPFKYVIHLAASVGVKNIVDNPLLHFKNNLNTTERLISFLSDYDCYRILFASTSEVYGKGIEIPFKEDQDFRVGQSCYPRWTYALSKIIDEFCFDIHCKHKCSYCILRFFNIVGSRQKSDYGMVLPRFVKAALRNKPLIVYDEGNSIRTFTSVYDCVISIDKILKRNHINRVYNIGSHNIISINNLATKVIDRCNSKSIIKYKSAKEIYGCDFDDSNIRIPDLTNLNTLISTSQFYDMDHIIGEMIEYEKSLLEK